MITSYDALTTTVALTALLLLVASFYLIFKAKMRPTASVLWFLVVLFLPIAGPLALIFYLKLFPLPKTSLPS